MTRAAQAAERKPAKEYVPPFLRRIYQLEAEVKEQDATIKVLLGIIHSMMTMADA